LKLFSTFFDHLRSNEAHRVPLLPDLLDDLGRASIAARGTCGRSDRGRGLDSIISPQMLREPDATARAM